MRQKARHLLSLKNEIMLQYHIVTKTLTLFSPKSAFWFMEQCIAPIFRVWRKGKAVPMGSKGEPEAPLAAPPAEGGR